MKVIQLVLGSLHHFCKNISSGTLSRKRSFLKILIQVFEYIFLIFFLPTYFPLTINYQHLLPLILIFEKWARYYVQDFFTFFRIYLQNTIVFIHACKLFWNAYIKKLFNKVSTEGTGIFERVVTNQNGHKNVQ